MVVTYKDWHKILPYVSHHSQNFYGCNPFLFSIWEGGGDGFRSIDLIIKGSDGCKTGRIRMGEFEIWELEFDQ